MKERPIIMSTPMVRAILAGTKTQTRRAVKGAPEDWAPIVPEIFSPTVVDRNGDDRPGPDAFGAGNEDGDCWIRCPYGQPGDRLWVREAHAFSVVDPEGRDWREDPENWDVIYRADEQPSGGWCDADGNVVAAPWRPSIHMPRWASRITLEITDVRVERLQEIGASDVLAEGAVDRPHIDQFGRNPVSAFDGKVYMDLRSLWAAGWESINGPGSWGANPWVWAISFRRVHG